MIDAKALIAAAISILGGSQPEFRPKKSPPDPRPFSGKNRKKAKAARKQRKRNA